MAAGTGAFLIGAAVSVEHCVGWLLVIPTFAGLSWVHLRIATRRAPTFLLVLAALFLGVVIGAAAGLGQALLFHRATGLWCAYDLVSAGIGPLPLLWTAVAGVLPHWAACLVFAGFLVHVESRIAQAVGGVLAGGVAGLAYVALLDIRLWSGEGAAFLAGFGVAYGLLAPLLGWAGDQVRPDADRTPRRILPVIAVVWVAPPLALLIGALTLGGPWLDGHVQAGLVPALAGLDLLRDLYYGLSDPPVVPRVAVCVIAAALAIGLCSRQRWAWVPWSIWWLHDLAFLAILVWTLNRQIGNLWTFPGDAAVDVSPLNSIRFYTILVGLGYVFAFRAWCLTRRGIRPLW